MKQTGKSIDCRILSANSIEYSLTHNNFSTESMHLQFSVQEPHIQQLDVLINAALKPYLVRNVNRTKAQDMTAVEVDVCLYETEQMKFERMMSQAITTKEQEIRLTVSSTFGLLLSGHDKQVGAYTFGPYFKTMKYTVDKEQLIVRMDVADDQIDKLKKDLVQCIREVYCFEYAFEKATHLDYYINLISKLDVKHYADNNRILVYTKKQEMARHALQTAAEIVQVSIDLKRMFQDSTIFQIIMDEAQQQLTSAHIRVEVRESTAVAVGQLPRIQQYETHLHRLYSSFKVKVFTWQANQVVIRLLEDKQKNNSLSGEAQGRDSRKMITFKKCYDRMEGSYVEITLVCRNTSEVEELYEKIIGELSSIEKQVLFVHPKVLDFLAKPSLKDASRSELERLQAQLNIQITVSQQILVAIGSQDSISKFKLQIQSIKDDSVSCETKEQNTTDTIEPTTVQLILSQQQYKSVTQQPFFDKLSLIYTQEDKYTFSIVCTSVDQAIQIKMMMLCHLTTWIPLQHCYGSPLSLTISRPVEVSIWSLPHHIRDRLSLLNGHQVSKMFMLQDRDNTFKECEKSQLAYCYTPLTIDRTLGIIMAGEYEQLASYQMGNSPVWYFNLGIEDQRENMCTYMVAAVKGQPDRQKRICCSGLSQFMPLWLIRLRPK